MHKMILFDPSYGTLNLGDQIINEAVMAELHPVFEGNFLARFSTHTPILHEYQVVLPNKIRNFCSDADLKFLGGTNLLKTNFVSRKPGWNINPITAKLYKESIAVGCGLGGRSRRLNWYTSAVYRRALSKRWAHSTRDSRSRDFLVGLGFNAINTGCPTMWSLTESHCETIPSEKSAEAVFTLTDYAPNPGEDAKLIEILLERYETVHFWVQGSSDLAYINSLPRAAEVRVVAPSVASFRDLLDSRPVDYVGTRLHAGICALQHKRRAFILSVDNRAEDLRPTLGENVVGRGDWKGLQDRLEGSVVTRVNIDVEAISTWKAQFIRFHNDTASGVHE